MSQNLKAHLALFTVALIYGANYSIAKLVLDDGYILPIGFILLRVIAAITLLWISHQFFAKEKIERKDFGLLFLCSIFGVVINQIFFFKGLKLTTPINAALIMTTTPIIVLIAAAIILGEGITIKKIIGVLIGAAGAVLLISYGKELAFKSTQFWGNIQVFINATSYAIYLVLVKKLMLKYHPITVLKWVFTISIVFILPLGAGELAQVDWQSMPLSVWLATVYVLIAATYFTYILNATALRTVNASVVSIYIYLQPVLAAIIALIFAQDKLDLIKVISAVLIFTGVYLVSQPTKGK